MKPELREAVRERLVKARALIERPEKWTKGVFARTHEDRVCSNHTVNATKFCMGGAVRQVGKLYDDTHGEAVKVIMSAMNDVRTEERYVTSWNDAPEREHWEVLKMFDRAIARITPCEGTCDWCKAMAAAIEAPSCCCECPIHKEFT
jgi:hypothetical protein